MIVSGSPVGGGVGSGVSKGLAVWLGSGADGVHAARASITAEHRRTNAGLMERMLDREEPSG
jgi:hypothetical protein